MILLAGGDGDDNVQGGSSNDIVSGNASVNTLTGGSGNDIFVCGPGGGDRITDFQPGQDLRFGSYIPGAAPTPTQPPALNFLKCWLYANAVHV
jgi:Ca2+-binding RTX toxin-like protein